MAKLCFSFGSTMDEKLGLDQHSNVFSLCSNCCEIIFPMLISNFFMIFHKSQFDKMKVKNNFSVLQKIQAKAKQTNISREVFLSDTTNIFPVYRVKISFYISSHLSFSTTKPLGHALKLKNKTFRKFNKKIFLLLRGHRIASQFHLRRRSKTNSVPLASQPIVSLVVHGMNKFVCILDELRHEF